MQKSAAGNGGGKDERLSGGRLIIYCRRWGRLPACQRTGQVNCLSPDQMSYPRFANLDVECWEHAGKLGFRTPSLCLYHAKVEFGQQIHAAIDELTAEAPPSKRTLTFKPTHRKKSLATMRLLNVEPREELRVMHFYFEPGGVSIEMTSAGLAVLRDGVAAWCGGAEDFGVDPDSANLKRHQLGSLDKSCGEIWFWGPTMEP